MMKEKVLSTFVSTGFCHQFQEQIYALSERRVSSYICFANAFSVVQAAKDHTFNQSIANADIVVPSGQLVNFFLSLSRGIQQEKISESYLLSNVLRQAEATGKAVYIVSSSNKAMEQSLKKITVMFPCLYICGFYSIANDSSKNVVREIEDTMPCFVLVAMDSPEQEKWMARHKNKIRACMMGIGEVLDIFPEDKEKPFRLIRPNIIKWIPQHKPLRQYVYAWFAFLVLVVRHAISLFRNARISPSIKATR